MRFILPTLFLTFVPGFSATLPLFFFPNTGQADSSIQYIVQTPDLSATFRAGDAIFHINGHQLGVRFAGANPAVSIAGLEPLPAKVNFFLGSTAWKTDVPTYSKVVYRGLYPGIDMIYGGIGRQVKSEFLVAARADPALIRLQYSEPVSLDQHGNLISGDLFREDAPEIYQQLGSERVKVGGQYRLLDRYTVGFEVGSYDESIPLVIDPTISYCSYLGGTSTTAITGVALDASANLYLTGWTQAVDFPTHGAYQGVNAGGVDVIVAKINAAGTGLLYASYIGGNGYDKGAAIAVDNLGQAYLTGSTASSNFPLVSSNRATRGGSTTAFVLKLNAAGNVLLYSGYLGGTNWETGTAIAVDSSYNAYIAGDTQSSDFPTKLGTQTVIGGGMDAFITKLDPTGAYAFSTFLGGTGNEHAGGIAVDSLGDIFVAGGTSSTNFPVRSPIQVTLAGTMNAFVAKYSYLGTVAFSTYFGGAGSTLQQANAIALDAGGNPYIAGVTSSSSFPVTGTAFQTTLNGEQSAFVTKMTNTGSAVVYSTYLGGDVSDWASGIAVSAAGNAYVAGWTSSVNFPQSSPVQVAFGGMTDAFVSEFNAAGNGLLFSTYYGGSQFDSINAIALDNNANIFTGGQTSSSDLPLLLPLESTTIASSTGWFLRLGVTAGPATIPSVTSVSPATGNGGSVTFTAAYADTGGGSTLSIAALLMNTSASTGSGCYVSYSPGANLFTLYTDAGTGVFGTVAPGGPSIQNSQCALNGVGSSAAASGLTLTVTFSLTFLPAFQGAKTVYLQAGDQTSTTGWLAEGTFTVATAAGTPVVTSVTPNAGTGLGATFTFVYGDTVYAQNLTSAAFLFNTSVAFNNACYVVWNIPANTISLTGDSGTGSTSVTLGSSTTLQNSQCVVQGGATSAVNGLSMILTISVTFNSGFTGLKNIYMYAAVGSVNTGWVQKGTFSTTVGGVPVGVSPAAGSGLTQNFTFSFSDSAGYGDLYVLDVLISTFLDGQTACYFAFAPTGATTGYVYLVDDAGDGGYAGPPMPLPSSSVVQNSQCAINATGSSVVSSGNSLTLTLAITFQSAFVGNKAMYMAARSSTQNSGWQALGTWDVPGTTTGPAVGGVSPARSVSMGQTYTFTFTDANGFADLFVLDVLTNSFLVGNNACYLAYAATTPNDGYLYLVDDAGDGGYVAGSPITLSSGATLQNSQCAINTAGSSVSGSGNTLTLNLAITFKTGFAGNQVFFVAARNHGSGNSGWQAAGSVTVP